jgi:hypothetical protein
LTQGAGDAEKSRRRADFGVTEVSAGGHEDRIKPFYPSAHGIA